MWHGFQYDFWLPGRIHPEAQNHIQHPGTSETVWAYYSSWCGKFELLILYEKINRVELLGFGD